MTSDLSPNKKYINQILDANQLLIKSDLSRLSLLDKEEMQFLEQQWAVADVKRRRKIIDDLVKLGAENATLNFGPIYKFCLNDSDSKVRSEAISGLAEDEEVTFISQLTRILHDDSSSEVRAAAAVALGRFAIMGELDKIPKKKTTEVFEALLKAVEKEKESTRVKSMALESIAPFSMPRVKNLITNAYESDNIVLKTSAVKAMGINCSIDWLDTLQTELYSDDSELRYNAIQAIGEIGAEDALPFLLELMDDDDIHLQEAVVKAIGEIGGDEAKTVLDSLAMDSQQRISRVAKAALEEIDFCEDPVSWNS